MEHLFVSKKEPQDALTVKEFPENLHVHADRGYELGHKQSEALLL
jgi:hypothetical protein